MYKFLIWHVIVFNCLNVLPKILNYFSKCLEPTCSKEGFGNGWAENCEGFGRACCKGLKCEYPIGFIPIPPVCVKDDSGNIHHLLISKR